MDLFAILHWLTDEVSKLAGKATAADVHTAITRLERGEKPERLTQPAEAEAPVKEDGKAPAAEPSTAEVLAEVLAAIRAGQGGAVAHVPAAEAPVTQDTAAAPGPAVDQGSPPEA